MRACRRGTPDRHMRRTETRRQGWTGRPELGTTSGSVRQGDKRNAGLAGDSTSRSLRIHELLLNAAFEEFRLQAVGTDFAVNQHGIALDPNEGSAKRRLILGNLLRVQNGVVGNLDVVTQLGIEIEPGMPFFRGGADIAAEKQRIGRSLGIFDEFCYEFILLGVSFVFSHA
jgi:hypothetical protein